MVYKTTKRSVVKLFFIVEVVIFVATYLWGAVGLTAIYDLYQKNRELTKAITLVRQENLVLTNKIADRATYPFFQEQAARERLHKARNDDVVYILDQQIPKKESR